MLWNMVHCEAKGQSHIKMHLPCQDKTYSYSSDGFYCVALADGAGSASLSHHGAKEVTKSVCELLSAQFDSFFNTVDGVFVKREIISHLIKKLEKVRDDWNCTIEDLASTLLFVAVKDDHFIVGHIGDGVIGYLKDNQLKTASHPVNGEFSNSTIFLTSPEAIHTMKLFKGSTESIAGFVLMSDGSSESLYNKRTGELADVLKRIMQLTVVLPKRNIKDKLQESLDTVIAGQTTDDCSLALLVRPSVHFSNYRSFDNSVKYSILCIREGTATAKKRLQRSEYLLAYLNTPRTLNDVAHKLHLKRKHAKKQLNRLVTLSLVEKHDGKYKNCLLL